VLVPSREQLEEEHRPGPRDRQIPDLVDDHETGEDQGAQSMREATSALRFFERVEENDFPWQSSWGTSHCPPVLPPPGDRRAW
jgi:hypothetical protein